MNKNIFFTVEKEKLYGNSAMDTTEAIRHKETKKK
jgi:hypothetical protein